MSSSNITNGMGTGERQDMEQPEQQALAGVAAVANAAAAAKAAAQSTGAEGTSSACWTTKAVSNKTSNTNKGEAVAQAAAAVVSGKRTMCSCRSIAPQHRRLYQ